MTIFFIVMLIIYFLPTIIAALRLHYHFWSLLFFNTIAGWTIFGWLAVLIWSFWEGLE